MKSLIVVLSLVLVSSCVDAVTPVKKETPKVDTQQVGSKASKILNDKEEDCDDKAKKVVEIKPESISLSGGDTGCSLDEIQK